MQTVKIIAWFFFNELVLVEEKDSEKKEALCFIFNWEGKIGICLSSYLQELKSSIVLARSYKLLSHKRIKLKSVSWNTLGGRQKLNFHTIQTLLL